jgi:hypothetical protein
MMKNIRFTFLFAFLFLLVNEKMFATDYYLKAGGTITTLVSWGDLPDGNGTSPANFTSSDTWNITNNNTSITLSGAWNVDAAATINIGDAVAACTLVIGSGGSIPNGPFINILDLATFDIQTNFSFANVGNVSPQTGSTIIYSNATQPIVALGANFFNLVIASNISINSSGVVIGGTLTINTTNTLNLNSQAITVAALAGSGLFDGGTVASNAALTINGTGGTLNTRPGSRLRSLTVNLATSTDVLTLGSDLRIDLSSPTFNLTRGILSIGARTFSNNATSNFNPNGSISGTSSSTLIFTGSTAFSGNMLMTPSSNSLSILTINRSGGRTLTLGNTLNIIDRITVTTGTVVSGGNLNIVASASKNAVVGIMGASAAISGNVTMNSFFASGTTGWTILGANGVTGKTISNLDGQFPITCTGCNNTPSSVGNFFSIQGWNEPGCDYDISLTSASALTTGKGFWVYLGSTSGASSSLTWSLSGALAQGNLTVTCTENISSCSSSTVTGATDGSNLVANPYPCPINLDNVYNLGNNSANFSANFDIYSRGAGAGFYNAVAQSGNLASGGIIPAGKGFYVNTLAGTAGLAFNESCKSAANGGTALFRGSNNALNQLKLKVQGQFDSDVALFLIHPLASVGYEKYDSRKMFSTPGYAGGSVSYSKYTSISSYEPISKKYLALNSFPENSQTVNIPVLVRVNTSGSYTISAQEFENYTSCVVLKDKLTNIFTDLKVKDYVFNISDTTNSPRFELVVCANGAQAVSVPDFFASSNISINQNAEGVVVRTSFTDNTKSIVSAYNVIGQKIIDDVVLEGTETKLLNIDNKNQVVLIKVVNNKESLTKKILIH